MTKCLKTQEDIDLFTKMDSYKHVVKFVDGMSESVVGLPNDAAPKLEEAPPIVVHTLALLKEIGDLIDGIPLQEKHEQRFGNKAYRDFNAALNDKLDGFLAPLVSAIVSTEADSEDQEKRREKLTTAFLPYLKDSFGNATRIDYGTGHELHFVIFLMIVGQAVFGKDHLFETKPYLQCCVFHSLQAYWKLMRRLQSHYTMEPAGTHGVWGLDDYHHVPFIVGAAQLRGHEAELAPDCITRTHLVEQHKEQFIYLSMIHWINTNKKGPFHEHSNILFNVSAVPTWEKTQSGMMKMYIGEVLKKRNIVQHLLFTSLFQFE